MIQEDGDTLSKGKTVIEEVGESLNITDTTKEKSKEIYTQAVVEDECSFTGRSIETVAGTCILIASRKTGDIRTANEVAEAITETDKVTQRNIHQTNKYICQSLDLGFVLADPIDFLDRISDKLSVDEKDITKAKNVIEKVKDHPSQVNTSARTMAAAAIYLVGTKQDGHGDYTQKEIGDVVDVSTLTIRENYREIKNALESD